MNKYRVERDPSLRLLIHLDIAEGDAVDRPIAVESVENHKVSHVADKGHARGLKLDGIPIAVRLMPPAHPADAGR